MFKWLRQRFTDEPDVVLDPSPIINWICKRNALRSVPDSPEVKMMIDRYSRTLKQMENKQMNWNKVLEVLDAEAKHGDLRACCALTVAKALRAGLTPYKQDAIKHGYIGGYGGAGKIEIKQPTPDLYITVGQYTHGDITKYCILEMNGSAAPPTINKFLSTDFDDILSTLVDALNYSSDEKPVRYSGSPVKIGVL
jgi:hypothetical protein